MDILVQSRARVRRRGHAARTSLYCFVGVFLGTLIGVLPGIGPVATVAMLLPLTFNLDPATAMIMLAGIYYGAQYGGSTTAILVNIPGESSSVVTTLDGYQMARQGRAGPALGIAAIGSFIAGIIRHLVVALFSPPLADDRAEVPARRLFLADGVRAGRRGGAGARLAAQGDRAWWCSACCSGCRHRRQFRHDALHLRHSGAGRRHQLRRAGHGHVRHRRGHLQPRAARPGPRGVHLRARPGAAEPRRPQAAACGRSRAAPALGSILGILPGGGALLASFAAYTIEKKVAKRAARFRQRRYPRRRRAGVRQQCRRADLVHPDADARRAVEPDHGADDRRADDPGHPARPAGDDATSGAVLGHRRQSMWIGNLFLLAAQPADDRAVGAAAWRCPTGCCFRPSWCSAASACSRSTTTRSTCSSSWLFSGLGYLLLKLGCEPAPLILGLVLGPMMEEYLRRALLISLGDPIVLVTSPISLGFLLAAAGAAGLDRGAAIRSEARRGAEGVAAVLP